MSDEKSLHAVANQAQVKSLMSIREHGLIPLDRQSNQALPNAAINIQSIGRNICVNHVNLTNATPEETTTALHVAVYEEYCGIYGILAERQWEFQRSNDEKIKLQEIEERLQSSIVFILEPPKKTSIKMLKMPGNNQPIEVQFYEFHGQNEFTDGHSQERGRSLLDESIMRANRVTEIKTMHSFRPSEILAALVPTQLIRVFQEIFVNTSIKLIEAHLVQKEFIRIPKFLEFLHNEKHEKKFVVKCPDFMNTLSAFVDKDPKTKNFSLHAVRLHTPFDFMPRYVVNCKNHNDFLEKNHAEILSIVKNDAWVAFHKSISTSRNKIIERLKLNSRHVKIAEKIEKNTKIQEEKFQKIKSLQGGFELFCYTKSVTPEKIAELKNREVNLFCTEHYVMFAFLNEMQKKQTLELLNSPKVAAEKNSPASDSGNFYSSPLSQTSQIQLSEQIKEEKPEKIEGLKLGVTNNF